MSVVASSSIEDLILIKLLLNANISLKSKNSQSLCLAGIIAKGVVIISLSIGNKNRFAQRTVLMTFST